MTADTIGGQVASVWHQQLAGAGNSSRAAQPRLGFKQGDGFEDS